MGRSRESVEIIVKVKRFTCFIGNSIDCEAPEWLILMKPRWSPAQEQLEICQPRKPEARDKFAFPLNLAFPFLICCLYSLVFRTTAFFCRSVLDIWQNMHRDWTDKWFCAKAIFIHSFTFSGFRMQTQFCEIFNFVLLHRIEIELEKLAGGLTSSERAPVLRCSQQIFSH